MRRNWLPSTIICATGWFTSEVMEPVRNLWFNIFWTTNWRRLAQWMWRGRLPWRGLSRRNAGELETLLVMSITLKCLQFVDSRVRSWKYVCNLYTRTNLATARADGVDVSLITPGKDCSDEGKSIKALQNLSVHEVYELHASPAIMILDRVRDLENTLHIYQDLVRINSTPLKK